VAHAGEEVEAEEEPEGVGLVPWVIQPFFEEALEEGTDRIVGKLLLA
jgi:hypothetical protein